MSNRQIKSGIALSYVYVFVNIVSGIFFTPYLIRSLGKSQYGLYEIIVSLTSNLSLLNLGMGDSVVKYVAKFRATGDKEKQGEVIGAIIKMLSIASLIGGVICFLLYMNFDNIYATSLTAKERAQGRIMFVIAALNLMVSLPGGTFGNVMGAYEKFGLTRTLGIGKTLFRMLLIIIFVLFAPKAMTILIIDTVLNILFIVAEFVLVRCWLRVPIVWKADDRQFYKEIFSFSAYVIFFMIAREVQFQTDKTIIGLRMSTVWVTIYAAGSKISATFNQLGQVLSGMYLPRAMSIRNDYIGNELEEKYRKYIISMGRILLPITSAVLIGFIGLGKTFMTLWIGDGYELAYVSASIMMIALFLPIIEDSGLAILKAEGKQSVIAIAWLISSIANVVLTWLVVPTMGIIGASIMTLITSYFINMVVLNVMLKREIHLKLSKVFKGIFKGSIPAFVGSVIVFFIFHMLDFKNTTWVSFIIEGAIFTIIFVILIYVFYLSKDQKRKIISRIKRITT